MNPQSPQLPLQTLQWHQTAASLTLRLGLALVASLGFAESLHAQDSGRNPPADRPAATASNSLVTTPLLQTTGAAALQGVIQSIDAQRSIVRVVADEKPYAARVVEQTTITIDGKAAKLTDLKAGMKATIRFQLGNDGQPTANAASIAAATAS